MQRTIVSGLVAGCLLIGAARSPGQCSPPFALTTPNPNTGQAGVMFDMEPTGGSPLRIDSFDIFFTGTATPYEVWVRPPLQSFVGFNTSSAGWTLIGSTTLNGNGTTSAVPMNLCMGYILQTGGRTGFYVTINTTLGSGTHWYNTGTAVGAPVVSDTLLTIYQGNSGTYFNPTISPRSFGGTVRYGFGSNLLSLSQSGPGIGDLTLTLGSISPTGAEGYLLVSGNLATPVGLGPIIGITPDAGTFSVFSVPYFPGNPLHFNAQNPGVFPQLPFGAPPGALNSLVGTTLDVVLFMFNPNGGYDSKSNVVRYTFI